MPWRLILFILIFAILLLFIVLNLENTCNISFGLVTLADVPVFLTVFFSFMAGLLCVFPFALGYRSRKKAKALQGKGLLAKMTDKKGKNSGKTGDTTFIDKTNYGID